MAFRVTVNDVKAIFETTLGADNIEAFIRSANVVINDNLTGKGIADATLKELERWLAAHFAAHMDPVAGSEKIGDAQVKYLLAMSSGADGLGLNNTPYGQQARILDPTGILASIGKPAAVFETALQVRGATTGDKGGE